MQKLILRKRMTASSILGQSHNYIPNYAIRISEEAKNPSVGILFQEGNQEAREDRYSQERVSKSQPSAEAVRMGPPDDQGTPG